MQTAHGSIFQAQAIQDGTGEADGKAVTGADSIDDVVDVIARHAVFLVIGRTDIGPMTAAHLDDDGLNAYGHGLALRGVDLARHDGAARLVGGDANLDG